MEIYATPSILVYFWPNGIASIVLGESILVSITRKNASKFELLTQYVYGGFVDFVFMFGFVDFVFTGKNAVLLAIRCIY